MQAILSRATSSLYVHGVKPILFKQHPDDVHDRLLRVGSTLQRIGVIRYVLRSVWAYEHAEILRQRIHGIQFENPVGLSAGFDKNFELPPLMKSVGFGFMEGGSITFRECAGNPRPWFYRLPQSGSLVVYAGLANKGVDAVISRLQSFKPHQICGFPLNISVAKTNSPEACSESDAIADYVGTLTKLQAENIGDMYTLNISCPNTYGGEPFTTPEKLHNLLSKVDELSLQKPVFVKMPCHVPWQEFRALLEVAGQHAVAGVAISNLAKDRSKANLKDSLPDSVKGNLSGKPTQALSNELIKKTYQHYGSRFTIIGAGGIFSAEDAYEKIKLGASLVELITGLIFKGPQLPGQINRDLVKLLKKDGYTNISQAIGASVK